MARLIQIEKELKKELIQTKDFLLELVGSIPVGIIATDLRGMVVVVNEQALKLLGMRELVNSALNKPVQKLVSGLPTLKETMATQFAKERSSFEIDLLEIKTPSDSQIFLRAKGEPILGGFLLVLEDITESKLAELELQSKVKELDEARLILMSLSEDIQKEKEGVEIKVEERTRELKEEQAQLMASINSLSLGFILCDLNDQIILKNPAVSRILEIPDSEITIDRIKKYFGDTLDLKVCRDQCVKEKKIVEIKNIVVGKKFFRLLLAPVIMLRDSEEIIGHILLLEDITEAKVIERSREEFFAVASHELRTPLTAIRGNASLIEDFYADKIKDKEIMAMISDIHEASVRLIKIVYDFLDVSALEQRKIEFKKQQFDIIALIQEVMRVLKGMADAKKLYLNLEKADAALPMAMADRDRTKQVLFNLINNGINYSQKGGVSVKVEKQDKFLKVYVSDTGIGILPKNQTLLFREFQQAGEKILTRDVTKGTGLGLYISKLLVEGMAGTIGLVKSEPGIGSVFSFTLPIAFDKKEV